LTQEIVVILDFGGQYTQLVARRVRELNVDCEILPSTVTLKQVQSLSPRALILSSGARSVFTQNTTLNDSRFDQLGLPMLEIGDGMELMAKDTDLLKDFLFNTVGLTGNWTMDAFVANTIQQIRTTVGPSQQVVCGLSGGVDSSVAAVLVHRAIGDRLTCLFVDHGLLRKDEAEQVMETFTRRFKMKVIKIDAADEFLTKLAGVTDPEQKRKIIGTEFIRVFEREAAKLGQIDFLVQGTLYTDVIESKTATGAVIKSHHNVGGLPEDLSFKLIEPLKHLFKDEVRRVGTELQIPEDLVWRHPFPGPGLAIRVLGEVTREKLEILRLADAIMIEEIKKAELYREIWQAFAILPDIRSVGVMNDQRTYAYTIGLRAVISHDGMTADWYRFPPEVLATIANRITNEVPHVNRVVYDVTAKPPSTIEWE
jgi:GMP synthase (glutamine-hydrolysing)